ncbi:MAG: arsenate reductase [Neolewinella sp.]|jgi:arsenate reductase
MAKMYQLNSCSTCKRIIGELGEQPNLDIVNIKENPITEDQLDEMAKLAGSYEKLFSRHARKYRSQGLNKKELTEDDYRSLILKEYTFLKRPVTIVYHEIFIGNQAKAVEATKVALAAAAALEDGK